MSEYFISREDAEADLLSAAAYLAERIKSSDGHAEAMLSVVPQYLAAGNVDLAAELSNTVDDPHTRDQLLAAVAAKCAELDDDEYALQLTDAIEDRGLQSQAFELIGLQKARKGQFEKASEVASMMVHPDGVLAGIAIKQAADGLESEALATIEEIEHAGSAVTAFLEIASNHLAAGSSEKAVEFFERAVAEAEDIEHLEERARAFGDIGMGFADAGRNDRAIETLDKAKSTAETIDNVHRDSFLAYTAQGFMHAGSVDLADRTLDLVADKTQISTALLGFARELWKKDEKTDAIDSLEDAFAILESQHERETRSQKTRFRLFSSIAAQFAGFEKGERAIEIAEGIKDDEERTAALRQVASILTTRKEDEQARQAYRAVTEDGDRVFTLIAMSEAKEKAGEKEAAVEVLDEAAELAESVPQMISRASAYRDLAYRYAKLDNESGFSRSMRKALEVISSLRDESSKAAGLASIAQIARELEIEASPEDLGLKTIIAGGVYSASN